MHAVCALISSIAAEGHCFSIFGEKHMLLLFRYACHHCNNDKQNSSSFITIHENTLVSEVMPYLVIIVVKTYYVCIYMTHVLFLLEGPLHEW
jgi:hypothetical protein